MVITDWGRLTQIVIGLQSNAIKYTLKGHVKHIISVEKENTETSYLVFEIQDTGIGIK